MKISVKISLFLVVIVSVFMSLSVNQPQRRSKEQELRSQLDRNHFILMVPKPTNSTHDKYLKVVGHNSTTHKLVFKELSSKIPDNVDWLIVYDGLGFDACDITSQVFYCYALNRPDLDTMRELRSLGVSFENVDKNPTYKLLLFKYKRWSANKHDTGLPFLFYL